MGSNTEYTFDLDQFHNDSPALILLLRRIGKFNPRTALDDMPIDKGEGLLTYASIGAKGTLDHENVHGRSLIGDGTPVDEQFWKTWTMPSWFHESFYNSHTPYIIPFSNDLPGVLSAVVDGYHEFRGDRERIRIRTGPPKRDTYQLYGYTGFPTYHYVNQGQGAAATGINCLRSMNVYLDGVLVGSVQVPDVSGTTLTQSKPIKVDSSTCEVAVTDPNFLLVLTRLCQLNEYAKCKGIKINVDNPVPKSPGRRYTFGTGTNDTLSGSLTGEGSELIVRVRVFDFEEQPIECEDWSDRIKITYSLNPVRQDPAANAPNVNQWDPVDTSPNNSLESCGELVPLSDVTKYPSLAGYGPTSQIGQCGFVDGTYEPVIYCVYYRHLKETQGRIVVDDM
jgi:hypothetical protein